MPNYSPPANTTVKKYRLHREKKFNLVFDKQLKYAINNMMGMTRKRHAETVYTQAVTRRITAINSPICRYESKSYPWLQGDLHMKNVTNIVHPQL